MSYRFRQWLANIPLVSVVFLKLCESDSGGSVVHAQWRWTRCAPTDGPKRPPELSPEERAKRADQRDRGLLNDGVDHGEG